MKLVYNVYDTSALLERDITEVENVYIPYLVFHELENIKTSSNKSDDVKAKARRIVREFAENKIPFKSGEINQKRIEKIRKKYNLPENNDGLILAEAICLDLDGNIVKFHTADMLLYLFAKQTGVVMANYIMQDEEKEEPWAGWAKYYPDEKQMSSLYANPQMNILNAPINQYCEIFQGNELKDILRWDGVQYQRLKYSNFRNTFLNTNIKPLNLEQKMAFDMLQNPNITVKVITGVPGGGKDYIQLLHALDMINKGLFDRIIYVRNLIPFKDAPEIGFLAGSLEEKISWGLGPIRSILGEEELASLEEQGIIQNVNLGFIRGQNFSRSLLYVSEGQNISASGYRLLVSRCGEGSQIWINADYKQTDLDKFKRDNGIVQLTNSLKGNPLFGTVKLIETERSKTAELAAII